MPHWDDLVGLPVDVRQGDEPWVCTVTAWAGDGDEVAVTWDAVAGSAHVRWTASQQARLVVEREGLAKVSVRDAGDHVEFHIWFNVEGIGGELTVDVGGSVSVADTLLRR